VVLTLLIALIPDAGGNLTRATGLINARFKHEGDPFGEWMRSLSTNPCGR